MESREKSHKGWNKSPQLTSPPLLLLLLLFIVKYEPVEGRERETTPPPPPLSHYGIEGMLLYLAVASKKKSDQPGDKLMPCNFGNIFFLPEISLTVSLSC